MFLVERGIGLHPFRQNCNLIMASMGTVSVVESDVCKGHVDEGWTFDGEFCVSAPWG